MLCSVCVARLVNDNHVVLRRCHHSDPAIIMKLRKYISDSRIYIHFIRFECGTFLVFSMFQCVFLYDPHHHRFVSNYDI